MGPIVKNGLSAFDWSQTDYHSVADLQTSIPCGCFPVLTHRGSFISHTILTAWSKPTKLVLGRNENLLDGAIVSMNIYMYSICVHPIVDQLRMVRTHIVLHDYDNIAVYG